MLRDLFSFFMAIMYWNICSVVAPKWKDSNPPQEKLEIEVQGNGILLCDAVGDPAPAFTWYKNGTRIISST